MVVAVALVGGLAPPCSRRVVGFLLLNYCFTPPLHSFTVAERENLLALLAFLVVAAAVSAVVDLAARRTREAARARAEAATLSTLAGSVLRGHRPLPALLGQLRETFGLAGRHAARGGAWHRTGDAGAVAGRRIRRQLPGFVAHGRRRPGAGGRRP